MRWLTLGIGALALWWWLRDAPPERGELQAAVLKDGFAIAHASGDRHRVIELTPKGERRIEHVVERGGELRVVGTRAGAAAAWIEDKRVRLVGLKPRREIGAWGTSARLLCEGAASSEKRFAVGWVEADDRLWIVHGPTSNAADATALPAIEAAAPAEPKSWCGVTSAGKNVALLWRDRNRLFIQTCSEKKCSGLPAAVGLDQRALLLGFGCLEKGCLIATREPTGKALLAYVTDSGGIKWKKELDTRPLAVSIIGAGDHAFAVGYAMSSYTEVMRVDRKGTITRVWQGSSASTPALAWARDRLVIGHHEGGGVATATVDFPR